MDHLEQVPTPYSGVARGLRGLEHPLSQKRKKIELVFPKIKIIGIYLSVIFNTKIGTYIRISV